MVVSGTITQIAKKARLPKSRPEFWGNKISETINRDKRNIFELAQQGWRIAVIWECGTKKENDLENVIERLSYWIIGNQPKQIKSIQFF